MTTPAEALKLALEALRKIAEAEDVHADSLRQTAMDALAQAERPAEQAQPVADAQAKIDAAPIATVDTRDALGLCAPTEADFPALYALQGHRVALVDLGLNVRAKAAPTGHDA